MASPFDSQGPPKPGVLGLITVVSFLLTIADVAWCLGAVLVGVGIATVGWLGGPFAGAVGVSLGLVVGGIACLRALLSILLFLAAWNTLLGRRSGRTLHRNWARITIVLDVLDLMLTLGMSPAGWWGLAYAIGVLSVMNQPEVIAYFERARLLPGPGAKPAGISEDWS